MALHILWARNQTRNTQRCGDGCALQWWLHSKCWERCLVQVSDAQTGELLATLEGHVESVNAVKCFSSGAFGTTDRIISGSSDGNIRIWDLGTAQCIEVLRNHAEAVHCMTLVGDRLFSGAADGLRVWSVSQHKCLLELRDAGDVRSIAVVASALGVASVDVDRLDVLLYDWETSTRLARLESIGVAPELRYWLDMSADRLALTVHDPLQRKEDSLLVWDFGLERAMDPRPTAARQHVALRKLR